MSSFTISEDELKKASMDAVIDRAKELSIEVSEDMNAKIKHFMDTAESKNPKSQEELMEVLSSMKEMPKEAIEGMFAMINAVEGMGETVPAAAAAADGAFDKTDIRSLFFTKRSRTQSDMDEMTTRYRAQFEPYADGKSLSDEDMLTMLCIRLEPEDITLEWYMNPVPDDILKDQISIGCGTGPDEITEDQIKSLLIVLAAYKEVYGGDIVHNTPTTKEQDAKVTVSILKRRAEVSKTITVTDEINSALSKMISQKWKEPSEYWDNVIYMTGGSMYQIGKIPAEQLNGILAGVVAQMKE